MKIRGIAEQDKVSLVRLMTDSVVRKYLGGVLSNKVALERANQYLSMSFSSLKVIEVNGNFAGLISFSEHVEEPGIEVSYQLLPEYAGQGHAYSALQLALSGEHQTYIAETQVANLRSRKLLNKLGFSETKLCERHGDKQVIAVRCS